MTPSRSVAGRGLNPQQQAVVGRLRGDTFVAAGAGSGKTRVLAERFAAIILGEPDEARPDRNAAARPAHHVHRQGRRANWASACAGYSSSAGTRDSPGRVDEAWISTIHGFCGRIVAAARARARHRPGIRRPRRSAERGRCGSRRSRRRPSRWPRPTRMSRRSSRRTGSPRSGTRPSLGLDQLRAMGRSPDSLRARGGTGLCGRPAACARRTAGDRRGVRESAPARVRGAQPRRAGGSARPSAGARVACPKPLLPAAIVALAAAFPLKTPGNAKGRERELTLEAIDTLCALVQAGVDAVAARHARAYRAPRRRLRRRLPGAQGGARRARLRGPAAAGRPRVRGAPRHRGALRRPVPGDDGRRVPGHQRAAAARRGSDRGEASCASSGTRSSRSTASASPTWTCSGGRAEALRGDGPGRVAARCRPTTAHTRTCSRRSTRCSERNRSSPGTTCAWRPGGRGSGGSSCRRARPRTEVLLVDRAGWEDLSWRDAEARALAGRIAETRRGRGVGRATSSCSCGR